MPSMQVYESAGKYVNCMQILADNWRYANKKKACVETPGEHVMLVTGGISGTSGIGCFFLGGGGGGGGGGEC